jgi:hypothetical protein
VSVRLTSLLQWITTCLVKLTNKFDSVDFTTCLASGTEPRFCKDIMSWDSIFLQYNIKNPEIKNIGPRPEFFDEICDKRLFTVFQDLQQFSTQIGTIARSKHRLSAIEYDVIIFSIQFRLLALRGTVGNIVEECLVTGMLGYLTTLFAVPTPGRLSRLYQYPHLSRSYGDACRGITAMKSPKLQRLIVWLLMVGCLSAFDVEEPWVRECWQSNVPLKLWADLQSSLQGIMWIESVHSEQGRLVLESMQPLLNHQSKPP